MTKIKYKDELDIYFNLSTKHNI